MSRCALALALLLGLVAVGLRAQTRDTASEVDATMTNRQLIEEWIERFNSGDIERVIELFAEGGSNFGRRVGRAGVRAVLEDIYTRFPDAKLEVHEWIADGDRVGFRATYTGTHLGIGRLPVDGGMLIGVPPTNKSFAVLHMHMFRVEGGLIQEHWGARDDIGMMRQLGLLPPPSPPPP
jgi:steroid delta-isomerase-like uncharacterized protein